MTGIAASVCLPWGKGGELILSGWYYPEEKSVISADEEHWTEGWEAEFECQKASFQGIDITEELEQSRMLVRITSFGTPLYDSYLNWLIANNMESITNQVMV